MQLVSFGRICFLFVFPGDLERGSVWGAEVFWVGVGTRVGINRVASSKRFV